MKYFFKNLLFFGILLAILSACSSDMPTSSIDLVVKPFTVTETFALQVDEETDLLANISLANDAAIVKVEIEQDGNCSPISDPHHFTPEYPGTCTLIYTIQGRDGSTSKERLENLIIKPLSFKTNIPTADIIATTYPWYNKMKPATQEFLYPYLLTSYAACNHSKLAGRVHVIFGETFEGADNIGIGTTPTEHGTSGSIRIKVLAPGTDIKGCLGYTNNLENYLNNHPNEYYFVSCAADAIGGSNLAGLNQCVSVAPLRRILEKKNVIFTVAIANQLNNRWRTYNESENDGNYYNSSSINSQYHNKITAVGYNHRKKENNYFSPNNKEWGGLESNMPVGFGTNKCNIVMPICGGTATFDGYEDYYTTSSFPTAVTSAVMGNAVAVVMGNHPGITPVDAMDIIVDNYLREETFQYMDETTNWQLTNGDKWYFLKNQELLNNEVLQADKLEALVLQGDDVELPQGKGICYVGRGIQFELDGVRHDITDAAALSQALKVGNVRWFWNRRMFRKQGGTSTAELEVYVTDLNGEKIPNVQLYFSKEVN